MPNAASESSGSNNGMAMLLPVKTTKCVLCIAGFPAHFCLAVMSKVAVVLCERLGLRIV